MNVGATITTKLMSDCNLCEALIFLSFLLKSLNLLNSRPSFHLEPFTKLSVMSGCDGNDRSLQSRHCNKHIFVSLHRTITINTVLKVIEGQMFKWTAS